MCASKVGVCSGGDGASNGVCVGRQVLENNDLTIRDQAAFNIVLREGFDPKHAVPGFENYPRQVHLPTTVALHSLATWVRSNLGSGLGSLWLLASPSSRRRRFQIDR
jgi:hypothetical protein